MNRFLRNLARQLLTVGAALALLCSCGGSAGKRADGNGKAQAGSDGSPEHSAAILDEADPERYLRVEERLRRRQQRIVDELNRSTTAAIPAAQ